MFNPHYIIVHHSLTKDSGTVSWGAIRRYHTITCQWSDIGYHFGIEDIGGTYEVLMGRGLNRQGAHTRGANQVAIGVCYVGNFDVLEVPEVQWQAGLKLIRGLQSVLKIPTDHIKGHRDFSKKSCPGKNFDLNKLRREL